MTNSTELGFVVCEIRERIAFISFSHPSHNSLPGKLLAKLSTTIEQMGQDDSVQLIVLQSEGDRTFCAGASFDELAGITDF